LAATSCGAVTDFFSAALGTRKVNCGSTLMSYARESALGQRAKIAGRISLILSFCPKRKDSCLQFTFVSAAC